MRLILAFILCIALGSISCSTMPTAPGDRIAVTGVVQDRDGNPVATAYVSFRPRDNSVGSGAYTVTDASGHYETRLNEGRYDVYLRARGFSEALVRDFEVSKDRRRMDYRFTGFWVRGNLTGPNGTFLPGAQGYAVGSVGSGELRTSPGSYSILLPGGSYEFQFTTGTSMTGLPDIRLPAVLVSRDTTIDVALDGNLVTGTIAGPGGAPLAGAVASAFSDYASAAAGTDIDGHYEMRLPAGTYTIRASAPEALSYIAGRQVVAAIQQPATLDFDLSGVRWSGFVRLASDSTPVVGARLYATELTSYVAARATSDAAGRYQLIVRPGAVYRMDGFVSDGSFRMYPFHAATSSDSTFDVYLMPGSQVIAYAGPLRPARAQRVSP